MSASRRALGPAGIGLVAFFVAGALMPNGLPFGVVVLGIVLGSLQALVALGLVLLYRASRIINFAEAEIGGLAAATAVVLVAGRGLPYLVAAPLGLAVAVGTGALIDATVVRRLFTAPRLIVTVATIGLAEVLGAAQIALPNLFSDLKPFTNFHAPFTVSLRIGPLVFGADHLVAVVVAAAAFVGLRWFLVSSDLGIAVRAAADSHERAALLGIPIRRLSRVTWMIAAGLSGLGAMLSAPVLGANVGVAAGPAALLVPLAAAVVARMDNLARAALAAVALSIVQQAVFWSYPRSSVVDVGLFGFVLVALLLQRGAIGREDDTELGAFIAARQPRPLTAKIAALPEVRIARLAGPGALLLAGVLVPLALTDSQLIVVSYMAIYGIIAISLVVLTGWAGQISLGQFAFVAVGAAATGGLYVNAGIDLFVALLASAVLGAVAAVLIGAPGLRLPGLLAAVTTLAFAVPVSTWLLNPDHFPALTPQDIPRPKLLGWLELSSPLTFAFTCLVVTGATWALIANVRRTRIARAMLGVRDNERGAAAYGIDPVRARLIAFGMAGALCGFAGGLYALALRGVGFAGFDPAESIQVLTMVVVGGLGSLGTALLGAAYVQSAHYFLDGAWRLLATGAGLLVLLLFLPGGLGSVVTAARDRFIRWAAARHNVDLEVGPPELAAADDAMTSSAAASLEVGGEVGSDVVLDVGGVDASYGAVQVLFGATVQVERGEVLALLGTNGAGKSTLLRVIAGLLPATAGAVTFDGDDLRGLDTAARTAGGIALMPGGRAVFPSLTVDENLRLGTWLRRHDAAAARSAVDDVLVLFPALADRRTTRAGLLSGGQQQMLGLALALLCQPRLLLIDELSLGLAPTIVAQLLDAVRELNRAGTTVVIVEQSLNVAASIAERAVFLERGRVRFTGRTSDLLERDDLARAVFLAPKPVLDAIGGANPPLLRRESVALAVRGLTVRFGGNTALDSVDLAVGSGECVGIIGSNGAGKTTLLDACSGFVGASSGTIELGGIDITNRRAAARATAGLGRSFQGARLFPALTVSETVALALDRHVDVREPFVCTFAFRATRRSEAIVRERADELIEQLQLGAYRNAFISELSTGTRRIVELACAMAHAPDVLLLDEPSSGLAQRETEALAGVLIELQRDLGAALVVVEHDMTLISTISHRLVCLHLGQVLATGTPDDVLADPAVVASYVGTDPAAISRSGRAASRRT